MTAEIINFETIIPISHELACKLDEVAALTGKTRNELVQEIIEKTMVDPDRMAKIGWELAVETGDSHPEDAAKTARLWAEKNLSNRSPI